MVQVMIVELRVDTLKPRTMPAVLEQMAGALSARTAFSALCGCWQVDVGTLNQLVHIWAYESLSQREEVAAKVEDLSRWPAAAGESILEQECRILAAAPFSPPLTPRKLGGVYELRIYRYEPGAIRHVIERWTEAMPEREKHSPLIGAWYAETGALNEWVHLWAFRDAGERVRVRQAVLDAGIWPPKGSPAPLTMRNMQLIPVRFSPLS